MGSLCVWPRIQKKRVNNWYLELKLKGFYSMRKIGNLLNYLLVTKIEDTRVGIGTEQGPMEPGGILGRWLLKLGPFSPLEIVDCPYVRLHNHGSNLCNLYYGLRFTQGWVKSLTPSYSLFWKSSLLSLIPKSNLETYCVRRSLWEEKSRSYSLP